LTPGQGRWGIMLIQRGKRKKGYSMEHSKNFCGKWSIKKNEAEEEGKTAAV